MGASIVQVKSESERIRRVRIGVTPCIAASPERKADLTYHAGLLVLSVGQQRAIPR